MDLCFRTTRKLDRRLFGSCGAIREHARTHVIVGTVPESGEFEMILKIAKHNISNMVLDNKKKLKISSIKHMK